MHPYLPLARAKRDQVISFIRELVECESPSGEKSAVDNFVDLLIERTSDIARPKRIRSKKFGDHLRLEFELAASRKSGQLLVLGHSDTVWPLRTLSKMPFRQKGGRLWGPGVLDMKSGLAFLICAVRILRELNVAVRYKVVLLLVSDEEVGSITSRPITEREARSSKAALVLEPGTGLLGKLKTARKGVGRYVISIHGRAAHAGLDFDNGASAILEAARQIDRIAALTDVGRGITVNPGVIRGGTASNVVAAEAHIDLDVRVPKLSDGEAIDRKLRRLKPIDRRCKIEVSGGINRPPMERTKAGAELFRKARQIGAELGITLEESTSGGGSDGNFTAALGIPTLDGLGGVGEGAHANNESILIERIPDRIALLAGLLAGL
jgi:glutamate carboxypeptidase